MNRWSVGPPTTVGAGRSSCADLRLAGNGGAPRTSASYAAEVDERPDDVTRAASGPRTVLRDARLADGSNVDVVVDADGTVAEVLDVDAPGVRRGGDGERTDRVIDLEGRLLLPALAEPHAHVDKALTADLVPNPAGDLKGAIDAWIDAAARGVFHHDGMVDRARRALELLVLSGVTAVRTHVNVGDGVGAAHVRAVREAAAGLEGLVDVQIVALTASPMVGTDGGANRAALVEALEVGVDAIGGCPHLEPDGAAMIAGALRAATEAGLPIDLHVDETLDADVLTLVELARQVRSSGFVHPVTASHCVSLGMQTEARQREIAREVADAGIVVVTLPQTNLFLQGRGRPVATPRGLTAIAALHDAGARVAAGADNVQDPFNLLGRSDPLETAALLVLAGHVPPDRALDMVSHDVRATMGLPPAGVVPGRRADLLAIGAPTIRGALATAPHDRIVLRGGRVVATSTEQRTLHRGESDARPR